MVNMSLVRTKILVRKLQKREIHNSPSNAILDMNKQAYVPSYSGYKENYKQRLRTIRINMSEEMILRAN
jgi:hypothetical protein